MPSFVARAWLSLALWLLAAFALSLFNQNARRFLNLPSPNNAGGALLAIVYLAVLLYVLLQLARTAAHMPHGAGFLFVLGLVTAVPFFTVVILGAWAPLWLLLSANSLFLPAAVSLMGAAIGRTFRHPNTLLAAAGFGAFFDIVVVAAGTVAVLLSRAPDVITRLSINGGIPLATGALGPPPLSSVVIGPADPLCLALFLSAVVSLRLEERATLIATYAALLLALIVVQLAPVPIPALAPMGAAVIAANIGHARFTRAEKFALMYGSVFALVLAVGMVVGARTVLAR